MSQIYLYACVLLVKQISEHIKYMECIELHSETMTDNVVILNDKISRKQLDPLR